MGIGNKDKEKGSNSNSDEYASKRFVASLWERSGKNGDYFEITANNLNFKENELDETGDYYKGSLLWYDAETEKYYKIKRIAVRGVGNNAPDGKINSLMIDLENDKHIEEVSFE